MAEFTVLAPSTQHCEVHNKDDIQSHQISSDLEKAEDDPTKDDFQESGGFVTDLSHLSHAYFRSKFFLGTFLATGLALTSGTAAFGYIAPLLGVINAELGPDPSYVWIAYVYSTALAVAFPIVGRLSDIFGRRYFFIGGAVFAVIGSIICALANTIPVLIAGNVFLGIATATQLSYHYVMGELVPIKYRYGTTAILYIFTIPGSGFGPTIAEAVVVYFPNKTWRVLYYIIIGLNIATLICWVLFYHPPKFQEKHRTASKIYWVKHFDYVGTLLFSAGFVIFLFGISAGGSIYAWSSAPVISMIVVGFCLLITFCVWEIYAPIRESFIPMHLFKNLSWTLCCIVLGIAASVYYGTSIIWPQQVGLLYGDGDLIKVGLISIIPGFTNIVGQIIGGMFINIIRHHKWQLLAVFFIGGVFLGCAAVVSVDNEAVEVAMVVMGCFWMGWVEIILLSNSTIVIMDQREVGIAGGTCAGIRSGISAIATVVYVTILTNRLQSTIPEQVPPALIAAGLPSTSIEAFIGAIYAGTADAFASVPGISNTTIAAGLAAYKTASVDAYRTVWYSTIAFSGFAVILCLFIKGADDQMTNKVAVTLHVGGADDMKHAVKCDN